MKKIPALFFAVLILCACFSAPAVLKAGEESPVIYAAFGDSIAAGYRLTAGNSPAYVKHTEENCSLSEALYVNILGKAYNADVYNYAKNGQTTAGLRTVLENASEEQKSVIAKASVITVSIGGNDLLGNWDNAIALAFKSQITGYIETNESWNTMIATLKENLRVIVSLLHRYNPDVTIYAQTMYNPYKFNSAYTYFGFNVGKLVNPYVNLLNAAFAEVEAEIPYLTFIDVASALNAEESSFYSDGDFHPTAAGHARMAMEYQKVISLPAAEQTAASDSKEEITTTEMITATTAATESVTPTASASTVATATMETTATTTIKTMAITATTTVKPTATTVITTAQTKPVTATTPPTTATSVSATATTTAVLTKAITATATTTAATVVTTGTTATTKTNQSEESRLSGALIPIIALLLTGLAATAVFLRAKRNRK